MNLELNYGGYGEYLLYKKPKFDGIQYVFKFPNGYGASVIKSFGSIGRSDDRWELAVIKFYRDGSFVITYDTEITDYVIGYQTDEDIQLLLRDIRKLKRS